MFWGVIVTGLAGLASGMALFWAYRVSFYDDYWAPNQLPDPVPLRYVEIDRNAGDIKLVGDIDGDGAPDLVLGGGPAEKLNWYRNPYWNKTVIATPDTEFKADGDLGDVDGDGDLDIVVPDGNQGYNLVWFRNPRPSGSPSDPSQWKRYLIGAVGDYAKDVELADFDQDGRLDVAARTSECAMVFFQVGVNAWMRMEFIAVRTGREGMASGDIDGNGTVDLVLCGMWLRNPGKTLALEQSAWARYNIGRVPRDFKALVVDLNKDGRMDVLFSCSEGKGPVAWWSYEKQPYSSWIGHTVLPSLEKCHTLQAADIDRDGDVDLVLAQMHTSRSKRIIVLENLDGQAIRWATHFVGAGGLHNGVVADIDNDGDQDIFGANWTGHPPARLWINESEPALTGRWTYIKVTDQGARTFGLAFADVDLCRGRDILAGPHWYPNPGGDMTGEWKQRRFPAGMHCILAIDVDGDRLADVIAQRAEADIALFWLEAVTEDANDWTVTRIGTVPRTSHALGTQGYAAGQIEWGGPSEIVVASGKGLYYFPVPRNPEAGDWPRVCIGKRPSDGGLALGDMDGDGRLDVAATTGDSKHVEWYQNPLDGTEAWIVHRIGTFIEADYPDRIEIADLNGDHRADIIVSEENGADREAETWWWEQPEVPAKGEWRRHRVVSQGSTNSMDVADLGGDDDMDVILAEHRGSKRLSLWINDGTGRFGEQVVSEGRESHLGARAIDLDGDGDLDIVSIAWDRYQEIHLWRNDASPHRLTHSFSSSALPSPAPRLPAWQSRDRVGDSQEYRVCRSR